MGYKTQNGFRRNIITTLDKEHSIRETANNRDVYSTVYQYSRPYQEGDNLYAPMYFDLDCNDLLIQGSEDAAFEIIREDAKRVIAILDAIMNVPEEYLEIYFSGGKGVHIIVPPICMGIMPHPQLNNIFHLIATDIKKYITHGTVDTKIYDNKRLFRLPNSINDKSGLYKIPLTSHEVRTLSFSDIKLLASKPRTIDKVQPVYSTRSSYMYQKYIEEWNTKQKEIEDRKNKVYSSTFNYTPPCIQNILDEGVEEGNRNLTIAAIASFYKQQGITENEALDRLIQFNHDSVKPSLHAKEIETTVGSIYSGNYKYGCKTLDTMLNRCVPECRVVHRKNV